MVQEAPRKKRPWSPIPVMDPREWSPDPKRTEELLKRVGGQQEPEDGKRKGL